MRTTSTILLSVLFGGVAASATPRRQQPPTPVLAARQSVVTPPPCEPLDPPPSAEETEQRFYEFTDAFLFEQNITRAFEYISSTYIVRFYLLCPDFLEYFWEKKFKQKISC